MFFILLNLFTYYCKSKHWCNVYCVVFDASIHVIFLPNFASWHCRVISPRWSRIDHLKEMMRDDYHRWSLLDDLGGSSLRNHPCQIVWAEMVWERHLSAVEIIQQRSSMMDHLAYSISSKIWMTLHNPLCGGDISQNNCHKYQTVSLCVTIAHSFIYVISSNHRQLSRIFFSRTRVARSLQEWYSLTLDLISTFKKKIGNHCEFETCKWKLILLIWDNYQRNWNEYITSKK